MESTTEQLSREISTLLERQLTGQHPASKKIRKAVQKSAHKLAKRVEALNVKKAAKAEKEEAKAHKLKKHRKVVSTKEELSPA